MIILKEGDKSKGPCENCRKLVNTTFRYAPLKYNGLVIPDILQGFCDECGESVSIPHQSSYKIKEFRERINHQLELRVPSHYTDILIAIGSLHKVSQKPNFLCRLIAELYLSKTYLPEGRDIRHKIMEALEDDLAKGKSNDRLSCLFHDTTYSALKAIAEEENVKSSTIVKGIIVVAKHDILDKKNKDITKEFEEFAAARL
jgi:hypothetical protein